MFVAIAVAIGVKPAFAARVAVNVFVVAAGFVQGVRQKQVAEWVIVGQRLTQIPCSRIVADLILSSPHHLRQVEHVAADPARVDDRIGDCAGAFAVKTLAVFLPMILCCVSVIAGPLTRWARHPLAVEEGRREEAAEQITTGREWKFIRVVDARGPRIRMLPIRPYPFTKHVVVFSFARSHPLPQPLIVRVLAQHGDYRGRIVGIVDVDAWVLDCHDPVV